MEMFMLISDDDSHWYVIPEDKVFEFSDWACDQNDLRVPDWAKRLNSSPLQVRFPFYFIKP